MSTIQNNVRSIAWAPIHDLTYFLFSNNEKGIVGGKYYGHACVAEKDSLWSTFMPRDYVINRDESRDLTDELTNLVPIAS